MKVLDHARKSGYVRVRIDGNLYELTEEIKLEKNIKHNIEVVVDRLVVREGIEKRLTDSIETVMALTGGLMTVDVVDGESMNFSQSFACPDCGISVDEVEPRSFSFNNPFGACPECFGLGYKMEFDEDLMIPDKSLSIDQGAIVVMGWQSCTDKGSFTRAILEALAKAYKFSLSTPFEEYPKEIRDVLLYGTGGREVKVHYKSQRGEGVYDVAFEGLIENVNRRYKETFSESSKAEYETYMRITPCPACKGQRLKKESLAVTVGGLNIYRGHQHVHCEVPGFPGGAEADAHAGDHRRHYFKGDQGQDQFPDQRGPGLSVPVQGHRHPVRRRGPAHPAGNPDRFRSGGRGLHPGRAQHRPAPAGQRQAAKDPVASAGSGQQRDLVVEHDEDTMRAADCIVDIGPGAGEHGGKVVASGTAEEIMKCEESITGAYLSGRMQIPVPAERRKPTRLDYGEGRCGEQPEEH